MKIIKKQLFPARQTHTLRSLGSFSFCTWKVNKLPSAEQIVLTFMRSAIWGNLYLRVFYASFSAYIILDKPYLKWIFSSSAKGISFSGKSFCCITQACMLKFQHIIVDVFSNNHRYWANFELRQGAETKELPQTTSSHSLVKTHILLCTCQIRTKDTRRLFSAELCNLKSFAMKSASHIAAR